MMANTATKISCGPSTSRSHRSKICPDIYDIGDEEQRDQRINDRRRVMAAHIAGESLA